MPLVSRSWSLQRLDEILDKVPIQPCPRHGLSLAQTPLPVSLPLSVWPVIPDRLDTSQHAIPHPSQPGLFSALLLSLCSTLRHNTGWLEDCEGLLRMTEQFKAVFSLSLSLSFKSFTGRLKKCCSALCYNPPARATEIITIRDLAKNLADSFEGRL